MTDLQTLVGWLEKQKGVQVYILADGRVSIRMPVRRTGKNGTGWGPRIIGVTLNEAITKAIEAS